VGHYLEQLIDRLKGVLEDRLIGVYAVGGLGFGDYRRETSDLDIYAVVSVGLEEEEKRSLAATCRHRTLPCPGRRLDLVVICEAAARCPGSVPQWELNLNTGSGQADHLGLDPAMEPSHWFVLDIAIARQHAIALLGPPANMIIGSPSASDVRTAQSQAIAWYAHNEMAAETVIAACRAWYWHEGGTFVGKRDAALGASPPNAKRRMTPAGSRQLRPSSSMLPSPRGTEADERSPRGPCTDDARRAARDAL